MSARELGCWAGSAYEVEGTVALTHKQLEALLLAYEKGYFEVPRETRLVELGDQLGISASPCSSRIRNAERALVDGLVPGLAGSVLEEIDGREEWVPPGGRDDLDGLDAIAEEIGTFTVEQRDPIGRGIE